MSMIIDNSLLRTLLAAAIAAASSVQIGDVFPSLSGQTVAETPLNIPASGAGRAQVISFSLSKTSGLDCGQWNNNLDRDFGTQPGYARFSVSMLGSAPRMFRGMILNTIKKNEPSEMWNRTLLLFDDNDLWKARLAIATDSRCYLFVLDREGRIAWRNSGPFTESEYSHLKSALLQDIGGTK